MPFRALTWAILVAAAGASWCKPGPLAQALSPMTTRSIRSMEEIRILLVFISQLLWGLHHGGVEVAVAEYGSLFRNACRCLKVLANSFAQHIGVGGHRAHN